MTNILILGGTTEASMLAEAVAAAGLRATLSYAGRVADPKAQPVPTRVGGFGGIQGLVAHLRHNAITHLVDATHPFAAQMTGNAVAACAINETPLIGLERPAWVPEPQDRWQIMPDIAAAAAHLNGPPRRIFLAIGRQNLAAFACQPQHHYVLRLVDAPTAPVPLPYATVIVARGPFDVAGDLALMKDHGIDTVLAKNAGGSGAEAKILAARSLRLPVIMIERPRVPARRVAAEVAEVMAWIGHATPLGV